MKLTPKSVNAKFINSDEDYTIKVIMGSLTLVYGDGKARQKNCKGVAFKDTNMLRDVAKNLLAMADLVDRAKGVP
jgi:hypothetical protein